MTVSPILADHAVAGPPQGQWTVDAWETLPDDNYRYEVVRGVLHMTTAPSFFHQWIVGGWIRYIGIPAQDQGLGVWTAAPIGVILSPVDAVQPDFVFVQRANLSRIRQRRIWGAPDLVVEVLSPGNSTEEMDTKRSLYARAGVPEYVVVDPATRTLAVYQLEAPALYGSARIYTTTETVIFIGLPTITLDVALLFANAPDTEL